MVSSPQLQPGERITHPEFGQGVVLDPARDGYLRAFFSVGERRVPVTAVRLELSRTERILRSVEGTEDSSLSIINVAGDSMEPTLSSGDEVLVDASDQSSRLRDGIYVLRADDALVVKRVTLKPGGRKITISSDNPAYPSWDDVDRSDIQIVGRVIWFGRAL